MIYTLRPKRYDCWLVTTNCRHCQEQFITTELNVVRDIPNGEAYAPMPLGGTLYDLPVLKKEVTRDVAYCPMCIDKVERVALPPPAKQQVLGRKPEEAPVVPDGQALLKSLGLI